MLYIICVNSWPGADAAQQLIGGPRGMGGYRQFPYYDSGFQRVLLQHNLDLKGCNSHVHRDSAGSYESTNLRDNLSREIGRTTQADAGVQQRHGRQTVCLREAATVRCTR